MNTASLLTWLGIGVGLVISTFLAPGQWRVIIPVGILIGLFTPLAIIRTGAANGSAGGALPAHQEQSTRFLLLFSGVLAAGFGSWMIWSMLHDVRMEKLPPWMASNMMMFGGMLVGISAGMLYFAKKGFRR